jgi:hypothetical protein
MKLKQQTLKTYEGILKQPKNVPIEVYKCKCCFKYFATNEFLMAHYKRKHSEFYRAEISQTEDAILNKELGELQAH